MQLSPFSSNSPSSLCARPKSEKALVQKTERKCCSSSTTFRCQRKTNGETKLPWKSSGSWLRTEASTDSRRTKEETSSSSRTSVSSERWTSLGEEGTTSPIDSSTISSQWTWFSATRLALFSSRLCRRFFPSKVSVLR